MEIFLNYRNVDSSAKSKLLIKTIESEKLRQTIYMLGRVLQLGSAKDSRGDLCGGGVQNHF